MLLGFYFEIKYGTTTDFGQVDRLSRLINNQYSPGKKAVITTVIVEKDLRLALSNSIRHTFATALTSWI